MELTLNEEQARSLLKEVMLELLQEKRDWFFEIMVEALEEIGLANAIQAGRQNEFVDEQQIMALLARQA
ncbi:MAG TPA: hypothetical protein PKL16_05365 [Anaerolineae bacterium]|mgnify:FL=1|nr:MAG: hypothetical protein BWY25_00667 [Chloroflexi bacterium ADurb.Bin222]HOC20907.1 hypothetical protein [Anaerolineae bacterium]HQM13600.1 hypothetical protein [Anaerolineae bacterium]